MNEDANICFLFKQFHLSDLIQLIEVIKAQMSPNPSGAVKYTIAENILSTFASNFPEYVSSNRSVNDASTGIGHIYENCLSSITTKQW